jgi:hypothetical protein
VAFTNSGRPSLSPVDRARAPPIGRR